MNLLRITNYLHKKWEAKKVEGRRGCSIARTKEIIIAEEETFSTVVRWWWREETTTVKSKRTQKVH